MASLFRQIKMDWIAHGKDSTRPGFRALAYYRFGAWLHQAIKPKLLRAPFSITHRFLYRRARNLYGIELPYCAKIGKNVVFEHQHGIIIHGNAEIGDGCIIRQGVTIGTKNIDDPFKAPKLGKNVNVGAGAVILGDITIGNNATIGANSVVVKSVPDNTTVVGIPARSL